MKSSLRWEDRTDLISSTKWISSAERISPLCEQGFHKDGGMEVRENKLAELSLDFAVKVIRLLNGRKGHYALVNQLERSATSIGANIREAKYAHSKADFVAKLQIALKECHETEYWLELMMRAELLPAEMVRGLLHDCGAIRSMLIASVNTVKRNMNQQG